MTRIESKFVTAGAVYANCKALVLNGSGAQKGIPCQDSLVGPVGGIKHGIVIIAVAAESGEPKIITYEQQNPETAKVNYNTTVAARVVLALARICKQVVLVIIDNCAIGFCKA